MENFHIYDKVFIEYKQSLKTLNNYYFQSQYNWTKVEAMFYLI